MAKTPDQRALPRPSPQMSREDAWAVVVENDGWVKTVAHRFVQRIMVEDEYYGYSASAMYDELIGAAYESALVSAETFDPSKGFTFTTYSEKVIWRDLTDELIRWRATTAPGDESLDTLIDLGRETDDESGFDIAVDPIAEVDERVDAERTVDTIRGALSRTEFAVLTLTADGYLPKEIAGKLGITNGNARVVLHRARDKARAALEGAAA